MKDIKVFRDKDGDIWLAGDGIYHGHAVCVTSDPDVVRRLNFPTLPYENVERLFGLKELTAPRPLAWTEEEIARGAHLSGDDMLFPKGYSV
jgi:hypothetical protein